MPLASASFLRYSNRLFPPILIIWIGLQLKGYYWIFTILLLLLLYRNRARLVLFFSLTRNVLLSAFLLIFSVSLLAAAAFDSGLQGLVSEIPVTLPILPTFILFCIPSLFWDKCLSSRSNYCLYALAVSILTIVSALWHWTHLADSPASSLRPMEIQVSSAGFLLAALLNCSLLRSPIGARNRLCTISLYTCSLVLSLISLACFRGATSASVFILNLVSIFFLFVLPVLQRSNPFLIVLFATVSSLALTLILDFRFLFLKFLVVPLYSSDIANGRAALLTNWIANYGQQPPLLIGSQPSVPSDFFAHNIILDSLIKDGTLAASSLLLFAALTFFFLLWNLSKGYEARGSLALVQFCFMAVPALLQPVQFSHAFAFLLSIATLGILVSWPNSKLSNFSSLSLGS